MKCFIRLWLILMAILLVKTASGTLMTTPEGGIYETTDQSNRNLFNRMICENEKLGINCEHDHAIKIERAYYGRYSITPCNKYHMKFTKGCTANDSLSIIQKLCDGKQSCEIFANSSTFGVPCPNSVHILEVIYACLKIKASATTTTQYDERWDMFLSSQVSVLPISITATTRSTFRSKPSKTTTVRDDSNNPIMPSTTTLVPMRKWSRLSTSRAKVTKIITEAITDAATTTVTADVSSSIVTEPIQIVYDKNNLNVYGNNERVSFESEQPKSSYSEYTHDNKVKCFSSLEFGNLTASLDETVRFDCSMFKKNYSSEFTSGSVWYQCGLDGKFILSSSNCSYNKGGLLAELNKRLLGGQVSSLSLMEKLSNELTSYFQANGSIRDVVMFMKNVSEQTHAEPLGSKNSNLNMSDTVFSIANTLLDRMDHWHSIEQVEKSRMATMLLDLIEKITFDDYIVRSIEPDAFLIDDGKTHVHDFVIDSENLLVELSSNSDLSREIVFPRNSDHRNMSEQIFLKLSDDHLKQKFMFISYSKIDDLLQRDVEEPFADARLLYEMENEDEFETDEVTGARKHERFINSKVVSFKMNDKNELENLRRNPVELTFKHLATEKIENENYHVIATCAFWKYNKETYEGKWSSEGCNTSFSNRSHSICTCSHLTHFAVLMDVYNVQNKIPPTHRFIMTTLTIVCSTISCVCIVFTLLAFRFIRIIKKNREQAATKDLTTITTHLCVCLLASLIVFLFGMVIQELKIRSFCSLIAMASHYLFLCSFFWMLLEGVQLYLMLIRIFLLDRSPLKKFCLIAYGVPFLIVLFSKLIDVYLLESRGYGTKNHCWLSTRHNFNLTFIVPVTLILIANLLILIIVVYGVRSSISTKHSQVVQSKKQQEFLKSLLGFWCLILTLLGIPWIVGYAMLDHHHTLFFSYLFTVLNSSQGTIIFIFHCVISKNVRDELLKAMYKQKRRLLSSMASSGSSNNTPGAGGSSPASSKTFIFKTANARQPTAAATALHGPALNNNQAMNRSGSGPSHSSSFKLNAADTKKLLAHQASVRSNNTTASELNTSDNEDSLNRHHYHQASSRPLFFLEYLFDLLFCFCFRPSSAHSSSGQSLSTNLDSNNHLAANGTMIKTATGVVNGAGYPGKSLSKSSPPHHYSSDSGASKTASKHSAILSIDEDDEEEEEENESISNLLRSNNLPDVPGVYQNHHQLNLNTLSYIQQHHLNNQLNSYLTNGKQQQQQQPQPGYHNMAPIYYTNGMSIPSGNFSIIPLINSTLVKNGHLMNGSAAPHNNQPPPAHLFQSMHRRNSEQASSSPLTGQSTCAAHSFMLPNGGTSLTQNSTLVIVPASTPPHYNNTNSNNTNNNSFSTFKTKANGNVTGRRDVAVSIGMTKRNNYDENQYLTPECHYHNYSTVDAGDVRVMSGANREEDNLYNNYVEVVDEFIDDCPTSGGQAGDGELAYMTLNGSGQIQKSRGGSKRHAQQTNEYNGHHNHHHHHHQNHQHHMNSSHERIIQSSQSSEVATTSPGETTASETNSTSPCQSSLSSAAGIEHLNGSGPEAGSSSDKSHASSSIAPGSLLLMTGSSEQSKAKSILRRL